MPYNQGTEIKVQTRFWNVVPGRKIRIRVPGIRGTGLSGEACQGAGGQALSSGELHDRRWNSELEKNYNQSAGAKKAYAAVCKTLVSEYEIEPVQGAAAAALAAAAADQMADNINQGMSKLEETEAADPFRRSKLKEG